MLSIRPLTNLREGHRYVVAPRDLQAHSDPRKDDQALLQELVFYAIGIIMDVNDGEPNWTEHCRHATDGGPTC